MLTMLEKQIQRAASQGNWVSYKALFDQWENLYNGNIPKARLAEVFINSSEGSPIVTLRMLSIPSSSEDNSDHPYVKTMIHMLNECLKLNDWPPFDDFEWVQYLETAAGCRWLQSGSLVNEKSSLIERTSSFDTIMTHAEKIGATALLEHPVTQTMFIRSTVEQLLLNGDLQQFREKYEENKEKFKESKVSLIESLFDRHLLSMPNDPDAKEAVVLDLIDNNEIGTKRLALFYGTSPASPIIRESTLFKLVEAISDFHTDASKTEKVIYLIQSYLYNVEDKKQIADLATLILSDCIRKWDLFKVSDGEVMLRMNQDREQIILSLLKRGAKFDVNQSIHDLNPLFLYLLENNMLTVLKEKAAKVGFQRLTLPQQKNLIEKCESLKNIEMMNLLCSYADPKVFETTTFAGVSNKFPLHIFCLKIEKAAGEQRYKKDKIKAEQEFQEQMQLLGIYLKYDLVSGIGIHGHTRYLLNKSPYLRFPDPSTNQKYYMLDKFIMDTPGLREGWLTGGLTHRQGEFKTKYSVAKALIEDERTDAELDALRVEDSSKIPHGKYEYNLVDIVRFMRENDDVAKVILQEFGGVGLTRTQREKTAGQLQLHAMRGFQKKHEMVEGKPAEEGKILENQKPIEAKKKNK